MAIENTQIMVKNNTPETSSLTVICDTKEEVSQGHTVASEYLFTVCHKLLEHWVKHKFECREKTSKVARKQNFYRLHFICRLSQVQIHNINNKHKKCKLQKICGTDYITPQDLGLLKVVPVVLFVLITLFP